ncbi:hypothetical protein F0562_019956 [Nyssa sinensis]|uniref:Cupin type-1 domain-containing protein n=1 Tax=Nyssa sinensis TaxID=561372 RepID=A0A5J5BQB5_9ASTE|nr:hypothetical protein F0562_019956 [Nyssa sinensis]
MMKMGVHTLATIAILALASSLTYASDPSPLQDFCVAINDPALFVNGKFCRDPMLATADDFFFPGLNIPRSTANSLGSNVTLLDVTKIAGLNTLGISLARIDFAPYGLNPPHTHPRATEILVVVEGIIYVGFVSSFPANRLFTKLLYPGDVFVFPEGLIHFQFNVANTTGVTFSGLGSQSPGLIVIANNVFGSTPPISPDVLTKAFKLDKNVGFQRSIIAESLFTVSKTCSNRSAMVARSSSYFRRKRVHQRRRKDVFVNGKFCRDPMLATADDFFFPGLNIPRSTANSLGSNVTLLDVTKIAGLNTLGISLARIDFAPYGLNPPHTHPRATELLVVVEGIIYVGFVSSFPANRLFTKLLYPGDVFVFPEGLIHFQFNVANTTGVTFSGLGSQNPGLIVIANNVFGSTPPISPDVLTKAFKLDKNVVEFLQKEFYTTS